MLASIDTQHSRLSPDHTNDNEQTAKVPPQVLRAAALHTAAAPVQASLAFVHFGPLTTWATSGVVRVSQNVRAATSSTRLHTVVQPACSHYFKATVSSNGLCMYGCAARVHTALQSNIAFHAPAYACAARVRIMFRGRTILQPCGYACMGSIAQVRTVLLRRREKNETCNFQNQFALSVTNCLLGPICFPFPSLCLRLPRRCQKRNF